MKEELERCSLFCLTDFSGPKEIFVGLRDRAMLLLSTTTAFRGASCRAVELSDLFPAIIPSPDGNESGIEVKYILLVFSIFDLIYSARYWVSSRTMPNTTRLAAQMNTGPFAIATSNSVQSMGLPCFFGRYFTSAVFRSQTLFRTSRTPSSESSEGVIGTITSCSSPARARRQFL